MRPEPHIIDPIDTASADITYLTKYVGKFDSGIAFTDPNYLRALAASPLETLVFANRMPGEFPADGLRYTTSLTEYRKHAPMVQFVNGTGTYHELLRAGYFPEHQRSLKVCIVHDEPRAYDFYATSLWNRENVRDAMMLPQDAFIFVSQQARDAWYEYANLGDRKGFYLPNTCAEEPYISSELVHLDRDAIRERLGYDSGVLNVVVLATIQPRKGQLTALRALAQLRLRRPELPVCIRLVGRATQRAYRAQLEELSDTYDLGRHVRVVGEVNKRGALSHLFASDVLAVTSESEAMPMVLLEAMLCGTPIVTTPVGGIPQMLTAGQAQFVEPGSAEQLADALETLADSPELGSALAAAARRRYWDDFSNARFTDRFGRLLDELTAGALGGRPELLPMHLPAVELDESATKRPEAIRLSLAARPACHAIERATLRFAPDTAVAEQLRTGEPFVRLGMGLADIDLADRALVFDATRGLTAAEYFTLSSASDFYVSARTAERRRPGGRSREARELARLKSSLRWRLADRVVGTLADNRIGRSVWRRLRRLHVARRPAGPPKPPGPTGPLRPAAVMVFNSVTQMMFALSLWDDRYAHGSPDLPLVAVVHSDRGRGEFSSELCAACSRTGRFAQVIDITPEYTELYAGRITFNRAVRFKVDLLRRLAPYTADTVLIAAFMSARAQKMLYEVFADSTIRLFEDGIGSYVPKAIRMADSGLVDRVTSGDCAQAHHIRKVESVDLLLESIPAPPQYHADIDRIEFPELTVGGFRVDFRNCARLLGAVPRRFRADEALLVTQNFSDHLAGRGFTADHEAAMNDRVIGMLLEGGMRVVVRPHPKASRPMWGARWADTAGFEVWSGAPSTPIELLLDHDHPPGVVVGVSSSCLFYLAEFTPTKVRRYPDTVTAGLRAAATDEYVAMLDISASLAVLGT